MLDVNLLEKADSKYSTRFVELDIEIEGKTQKAVLEIDEVFRQSKIKACVQEFVEKMDYTVKIDKSFLEGVQEVYLIFLIIKHFSSFPAPNSYTEQVKIINKFIDNKLLFEIYKEFDRDQIARIQEELNDVLDKFDENIDIFLDKADGIEERFESPDLMS